VIPVGETKLVVAMMVGILGIENVDSIAVHNQVRVAKIEGNRMDMLAERRMQTAMASRFVVAGATEFVAAEGGNFLQVGKDGCYGGLDFD
jgi:hypothetical protein